MNTKKDMKRYNHYIAWLFALTLTFSACDKIEPDFFNGDYNGAYFDYQYASDYETTVNFGEHIIGNPQEVPVVLNVKLLGYLKDESRSLSIKAKEVEDYPLAEVVIPDVTFANQEYQKGVEILVKRPEVENEVFAVCIYLDGEGDLGTGINGKDEYTIYVKEVHEKPSLWDTNIQGYLGSWDREKHAFFANLMNNDYYYNDFKSSESNGLNWEYIEDMNVLAVNTLLSEESQEPIAVGIPILKELNYNTSYNKPYFWDNYKEYLGFYSSSKFYDFTLRVNSANTHNIIQAYENANEKMEEMRPTYHKEDFLTMLNAYYEYPKLGYTIDQYKELIWVEIVPDMVYIDNGNGKSYVRIPYWWEDPDNLGTGEIVEKCFGEYNDAKYQFMIKALIEDAKKNGTEDEFVVASMLPFAINGDSWDWDETVGGLEKLKKCHEIIIAKIQATIHKIPKEVDWDIIAK